MAVLSDSEKKNVTTIERSEKSVDKKSVVYDTKDLNLWYGGDHALKNINLSIHENEVTAIIDLLVVENRHLLKH